MKEIFIVFFSGVLLLSSLGCGSIDLEDVGVALEYLEESGVLAELGTNLIGSSQSIEEMINSGEMVGNLHGASNSSNSNSSSSSGSFSETSSVANTNSVNSSPANSASGGSSLSKPTEQDCEVDEYNLSNDGHYGKAKIYIRNYSNSEILVRLTAIRIDMYGNEYTHSREYTLDAPAPGWRYSEETVTFTCVKSSRKCAVNPNLVYYIHSGGLAADKRLTLEKYNYTTREWAEVDYTQPNFATHDDDGYFFLEVY